MRRYRTNSCVEFLFHVFEKLNIYNFATCLSESWMENVANDFELLWILPSHEKTNFC